MEWVKHADFSFEILSNVHNKLPVRTWRSDNATPFGKMYLRSLQIDSQPYSLAVYLRHWNPFKFRLRHGHRQQMSSGEGRNLRPTLTDHVSARIGSDEGLTHSQSPFRLSAESTSLELDVHTKSENPKKVVLLIIYSPLRYCQEEDTNAGRSGDLTHGVASIGIGAIA